SEMTLLWLSRQLWRHRVKGLLVTLVKRTSHEDDRRAAATTDVRPIPEDPGKARPHTSTRGHPTESKRRRPPPLAFLKIHKTGSSTVQNLLFRLGEKEKAAFAFPYYTYQFAYPERFRSQFVDELPEGAAQFDILCSHMRLDLAQLRQVMPQNTVFFTLLRDPVRTFESVFSYFTATVPAFAQAKAAAAVARKSALSVFLESPESFWDPGEIRNGLAKNPMCFDLGLNSQGWNASWPEDLAQLEDAFQLVMIAEHFDESLVLLGALLGLDHEDLAYVRLNARSAGSVATLDEGTVGRLRSWNALDVLLYDFFLQLFWEKAELYGLDRLERDAALLREAAERLRQTCVARRGVPPGDLEDLLRPWQTDTATVVGYELRANLSQQQQGRCVRLTLPELQYHTSAGKNLLIANIPGIVRHSNVHLRK
uniref:Galactose-3-O-sulfotransferase 4 n=1 Tax=Denticeps clupeoides TaxID=299321 RepID=A0AAY4BUF1_9TELE